MRVKIAPNDPQSMSQDGDAILRSLQNKSLPIIDLMVRESLQNSLDAAIEGKQTVKVDFKTGIFSSERLAPYFESISGELVEKFPGNQTVLSISDKNTYGLTGDLETDNIKLLDKSNFQKLVFGIGKNQEKAGAGGSWGLGKTSFFRAGIGLVMYYTRILNEEKFEERLIASLIESPKKEERLLERSERGIAWWGELDTKRNKILPITDHNEIKRILMVFGLDNYEGNETGTTIIIPYLRLLEDKKHDDEIEIYPWERCKEESIKMAVQRWYSPRIHNEKYTEYLQEPNLDCSVNGLGIHPLVNMEPVFNIFQDLYTSALVGKPIKPSIIVELIKFPRNVMQDDNAPVGHVAFCEVNRDILKMTSPNNKPSALAYLGIKDKTKIEKNISKVMAYARKPGMVVEYSVDGDWVPTGVIQKEDCLVLSFFVPNSNGILLETFRNLGYCNMESYLRSTENSDHANWKDESNFSIIKRIKSYSKKAIQNAFLDPLENGQATATSSLSRKFGSMLMPPKNFGKTSARQKNDEKNEREVSFRNRISDISVIESVPIDEKNVKVSFKVFIKQQSISTIFLQVLTQDQKMDKDAWEKVMGTKIEFPFSIQRVYLSDSKNKVFKQAVDNYSENKIVFDLNLKQSNCFRIISKVQAEIELEGTLYLTTLSKQYLPNLAIKSDIKNEKGEE